MQKQLLGETKHLFKPQLLECKGLSVALTDGEVRATMVQMSQAYTVQVEAITAQPTREGSPRENLYASTMDRRLRTLLE